VSEARAAVLAFNACINAHDLAGLAALMTLGHIFTDSAGGEIRGKDACLAAWQAFFAAFPDYQNHFETVREGDGLIAISGRSSCADARLNGPALWSARVEGGLIAEWRVHADNPENRCVLGLLLAPG
jgi:ketosteroid isomerase-like protein